ncbi:MAG: hypothetical protein DCC64_11600 [Planctomycetota bacterium]|nr:MAG: hypothetical protein DCC64_11600 [Planctomycetota bacterium]
MIRSLFAYIFVFTAGLACAASYFYSLHPEHTPEDDMPKMRIDLEDALERARRAKDAWESAPPPPQEEPARKTTTPARSDASGKGKRKS